MAIRLTHLIIVFVEEPWAAAALIPSHAVGSMSPRRTVHRGRRSEDAIISAFLSPNLSTEGSIDHWLDTKPIEPFFWSLYAGTSRI